MGGAVSCTRAVVGAAHGRRASAVAAMAGVCCGGHGRGVARGVVWRPWWAHGGRAAVTTALCPPSWCRAQCTMGLAAMAACQWARGLSALLHGLASVSCVGPTRIWPSCILRVGGWGPEALAQWAACMAALAVAGGHNVHKWLLTWTRMMLPKSLYHRNPPSHTTRQ